MEAGGFLELGILGRMLSSGPSLTPLFSCLYVLPPCPASGKSFREEQCEAFNGYNHSTNRLTLAVAWVPKYSGVSPRDKCKLICRANGTGYFYVLAPKVSVRGQGTRLGLAFRGASHRAASLCCSSGDSTGGGWHAVFPRLHLRLCPRQVHQGWLRWEPGLQEEI